MRVMCESHVRLQVEEVAWCGRQLGAPLLWKPRGQVCPWSAGARARASERAPTFDRGRGRVGGRKRHTEGSGEVTRSDGKCGRAGCGGAGGAGIVVGWRAVRSDRGGVCAHGGRETVGVGANRHARLLPSLAATRSPTRYFFPPALPALHSLAPVLAFLPSPELTESSSGPRRALPWRHICGLNPAPVSPLVC